MLEKYGCCFGGQEVARGGPLPSAGTLDCGQPGVLLLDWSHLRSWLQHGGPQPLRSIARRIGPASPWLACPPPDPRPLFQSVDRLHPGSAHQPRLSRPALQLPLWSDSFFPWLALLPPNPLAWQQPGHLRIDSGLARRPLGTDPAVLVSGEGMAIEREGDKLDRANGEAGGEGVEEAEGGEVVDGDLSSRGGVEEERGGIDHDGDGGGANCLEGGGT